MNAHHLLRIKQFYLQCLTLFLLELTKTFHYFQEKFNNIIYQLLITCLHFFPKLVINCPLLILMNAIHHMQFIKYYNYLKMKFFKELMMISYSHFLTILLHLIPKNKQYYYNYQMQVYVLIRIRFIKCFLNYQQALYCLQILYFQMIYLILIANICYLPKP